MHGALDFQERVGLPQEWEDGGLPPARNGVDCFTWNTQVTALVPAQAPPATWELAKDFRWPYLAMPPDAAIRGGGTVVVRQRCFG
jgi:hypothetical protein